VAGVRPIPLPPNAAFLTIDLYATRTENTRAREQAAVWLFHGIFHIIEISEVIPRVWPNQWERLLFSKTHRAMCMSNVFPLVASNNECNNGIFMSEN